MALLPQDLQPGDVLLHAYADSQLCNLIAWCSGGIYSHAALYLGDGQMSEASAEGVRAYSLATRMGQQHKDPARTGRNPVLKQLDVLRLREPLSGEQQARLVGAARDFIHDRTPYPMSQLAELGIALAVRNYLPGDPWRRGLLYALLDAVPWPEPGQQVCSEHVYRVHQQASRAPAIAEAPALPWTEPPVHWKGLLQEYWEELEANHQAAAEAQPPVEAHELQARHASALARLAAIDRHPNPRLITPQDLARSPDFIVVGSLVPGN
jgi:hypothetical protein